MSHYDENLTAEDIGIAVLARLAAMVSMRHKGPITSLTYSQIEEGGADALVADFVALSSGYGERHREGCTERLHHLGMTVLRNTLVTAKAGSAT